VKIRETMEGFGFKYDKVQHSSTEAVELTVCTCRIPIFGDPNVTLRRTDVTLAERGET